MQSQSLRACHPIERITPSVRFSLIGHSHHDAERRATESKDTENKDRHCVHEENKHEENKDRHCVHQHPVREQKTRTGIACTNILFASIIACADEAPCMSWFLYWFLCSSSVKLIEERNRSHRGRLRFGVHPYLMPAVKPNGRMISMSDSPSHENRWIALHHSPVVGSRRWIASEQP
jgi:hypothetical protein